MKNADWDDIQDCLNGDEQAYGRLVRQYQAQVAKLMWRFSRNYAVCERLVQDVFVEAYFSLKSYGGKAPFIHWLRKIGTRVGYRFWKEQEEDKVNVPLMDFDGIEKVEEDSIDPSQAAEILQGLLGRLPKAERLVLTLIYFEDCSTREIAERMGWTRAMVKMRAYRARNKIKGIAEKENLLEKLGWTH